MVTLADARARVEAVADPELPLVTIAELGILRDVTVDGNQVTVTITPTYSGCPAMSAIAEDIEAALHGTDADVSITTVLSPAWTTDWMTPAGRDKLHAAGIAPPAHTAHDRAAGTVPLTLSVRCPQCGSSRTSELSRFGSTSCKALWRCDDCLEPFDSFKVI